MEVKALRLKKHSPDFLIFLTTFLLLTIGIIMVFSSSALTTEQNSYIRDAYYYLRHQLTWAFIGIIMMMIAMSLDFFYFKNFAWIILFIGIFLLILVLIPGIGKEVKGAQRAIDLGPASFTPSEMTKLCLIYFMAYSLSRQGKKIENFVHGLLPHLFILMIVLGLIMKQPDLGTAVSIAGTTLLMIMVAGARWRHLISIGLLGLGAVIAAILLEPYRLRRLIAFWDPWQDPLNAGFQTIQSLYALGSGGLFGVGLGCSHQKLFYLPEQHTDFIFSILGEELGYLGVMVVLALFFLFIWRGLRIAITCPDVFGSLLAVGITCMVGLQAIINIGVVSGSLPVTGITLPFISYGGSSLLFNLIGVGVLLNISKFSTVR